jgi:hypothetical protein
MGAIAHAQPTATAVKHLAVSAPSIAKILAGPITEFASVVALEQPLGGCRDGVPS